MKTFVFRVWRSVLVVTAAGAIGTTAVQAQIGFGKAGLPEPVSPAPTDERDAGEPSTLYGTDDVTSHTLQAFAFTPFATGTAYNINGFGARYCTSGSCFFAAPLLLPAGALIEAFELEACDSSAGASVGATLVRTGASEVDSEALAIVSTGSLSETPGCDFLFLDLSVPATVDNLNNSYFVIARFTNGTDDTVRFQAARVFYRLQVSPPPASATFDDVPTDHLFFPFIEALAASGITSGCGDGNFCPNAPLTRGQMGTFLAKALGLHWAP